MTRKALLLLLVLSAMALWPSPAPGVSAEGIEVRTSQAQSVFPNGLQFTLFVASDADITSARLHFRILPETLQASTLAQCTTGRAVNCRATVGGPGGAYLVPKADVVYSWEVQDAAGNSLNTPEASQTYEDTRFQWQSQTQGQITAYYYFGGDQTIQSVIKVAQETLDRMSALEGTKVDFPVKVLLYRSIADLQPAVASRRDPGRGVTLGEVSAADTALVAAEGLALDTVRHELTHIVTDHATDQNPQLAIWINEGISMYAQNDLPDEKNALDLAIRRNRAYPLSTMTSSAIRSNDPNLFYGEAWSMMRFMIDTLGQDKFREFLVALNRDTTEGAMQKVYGFGLDAFEDRWRQSVGLPPIAAAQGQSGGTVQALPTIIPFGAQGSSGPSSGSAATPPAGQQPQSGSTEQGDGSGGGSDVLIVIGAVVLLVVLSGGGFYLVRRRIRPPATPAP